MKDTTINFTLTVQNENLYRRSRVVFASLWTVMKRLLLVVSLLSACLHLVPADDADKEDVGTVIGIDLGTTYSW